ncbi:hypothetical protein [Nocardiopsis lucentensis]|uniref:hypothetical protein n=1 Tax=Nocardiopsis lucentensis TaxID=53441 RepID=UPI00034C26C3|nr:hypothetical protein [Nocardiopsis lucentensis]
MYGLPGGECLGRVAGGAEAVAGVVGGRPLLAVGATVYALPDLTVVAELGSSATAHALTEWDGTPVVVVGARESGGSPDVPARERLGVRRLAPPNGVVAEFDWLVPGRLFDAVASPDGTVFVTTSEGLYAVRRTGR